MIVFITCQTREECVIHWYHYKEEKYHIKVRDSSLALYRGWGEGRLLCSFLSEKKIEVFSLFSKKRIEKFGVFKKINSKKGFLFTYFIKLSAGKYRKSFTRSCCPFVLKNNTEYFHLHLASTD